MASFHHCIGGGSGTAEPIGARVRGSVVYIGFRVMHDCLPATHGGGVFVPHVELMPHRGKFLPHFGRHSRFDHDVAPMLRTDSETGVLQSLLDIHAVVDHVGNELRVGQRLVRSSHDPEANVLLSMLHASRNDGVERPLARGEGVRRRRIERKQRTAILQHESHAVHHNVRAERFIIALNQRDDVALAIHDRKVSRVTGGRRAGRNLAIGFAGIDQ